MTKFKSNFAKLIEEAISYKESLGYSRSTYEPHLLNFDRFCSKYFSEKTILEKDIVLKWMEKRPDENSGGLKSRATTIRIFGKYLQSIGVSSYVLPEKFVGGSTTFNPYIFTNKELKMLFESIDSITTTKNDPFKSFVLPVIFRLIYTCGLRPNEGRNLKRQNISFDTGEVLITNTKYHKERIIVMSDDMLSLCKKYDKKCSLFYRNSEYFFPSPNEKVYSSSWISKEFNICWIKACRENKFGEIPRVRVYDLRHRFASAVLNKWLDEKKDLNTMLPYLCSYMGHDNISYTAHYIHLLPENLVKSNSINWSAFSELIPEVSIWPE